ncbi:hypothetical protein [Methyloversatilis thermotolerans]|uniref:hypothetical protein n=1 Tax=Methyloversatilis thermotolerans TaxID=1346290 RepID=UPI00039CEFBF|nr:hypothetical protein [Methyloversatilis thermotolerans]
MRRHQRGAMLLALLGVIAALGSLLLLRMARARDASPHSETGERALARAREALIAYAALGNAAGNHDNSPGALPCPDLDNDGVADFRCSADIGRLPWRTLGLGLLTDHAGECLWYVRSPAFGNNIPTAGRGGSADRPALNPALAGQIGDVENGQHGTRTWVALVIAPGDALPHQQRGATDRLSGCRAGGAQSFLDRSSFPGLDHAQGKVAIREAVSEHFNDRVIGIDATPHFSLAAARVLGDVELSGGAPPHAWWSRNRWCESLCADGPVGVIRIPDGEPVRRPLAALPGCALPCERP